jgi:hypothetical protein
MGRSWFLMGPSSHQKAKRLLLLTPTCIAVAQADLLDRSLGQLVLRGL